MKRELWIESRRNELLPTTYFRRNVGPVVFTLPHALNRLILGNRKRLFAMLFSSASETLLNYSKFDKFLGAQTGITMILHSWGQDLSFHPHVHCIVSGGGYLGGKWIEAKRPSGNFIFPVAGLRQMYKAIFLKKLRSASDLNLEGIKLPEILTVIEKTAWNVYAKAPFGGPAQVVEYLGRYSQKIAITHHRILEVSDQGVRFKYKDYADNSRTKEMTLSSEEFLRRFDQHILPKGLVKIRHYGYLQNRNKYVRLNEIRASLSLEPVKAVVHTPVAIRMLIQYGQDIFKCPHCETGRLALVHTSYGQRTPRLRNKASPPESQAIEYPEA